MTFTQFKLDKSVDQTRGIFNKYIYKTEDTIADVQTAGYFTESRFAEIDNENTNGMGWIGGLIDCRCSDGYFLGEIEDDGSTIIEVGSDENIARPTSEYDQTVSNDIIIGDGVFDINLVAGSSATKSVTIRAKIGSTLTLVPNGSDTSEVLTVLSGTSTTLVFDVTGWIQI